MPTQPMQGRVLSKKAWFQQTNYEPHWGQEAVHYDRHRHRVLSNGRRWGKTLLGGKEVEPTAFVKNLLGEPQHIWIVGPEFKDCEKEFRVVHDTMKKLDIHTVSTKFLNNVDNGNMVIKTNWGWWLECRSALHPETLVGEGLDGVLMVEAGRQKRRTWTEYIRPALSDKRGWSLHTGVPEGATQTSLLYALWLRGQSPTTTSGKPNPWKSWRMPSWTNTVVFPGGRTDPEILDAEDDLTEEEFNRQYGAMFVDRIGRVMADWDDEIHLADLRYNRDWPTYLAVDYGFTNPFVILWIQVDPFNNVYVIWEKRWTLKDTPTIAKEVMADPLLGPLTRVAVAFYPDPAEPDDTQTLMREFKLPARGKTGGELLPRLKLIWAALKEQNTHLEPSHELRKPRLLIDRTHCTMLAWEMREGYRWPEHKSETKNESENPLDKDNHGCEALGRFFGGYMGVHGKKSRGKVRRVKYKASYGGVTRTRKAVAS